MTNFDPSTEFLVELRKKLAGELFDLADAHGLRQRLLQSGTFDFPVLETGLFPAITVNAQNEYTGYGSVWVRDNVHVAHAHYVAGERSKAIRAMEALRLYFSRHEPRFRNIVDGVTDPNDPMNRPHIRFDGRTLGELPETWPHAQNDALGYFVWFYCRLIRQGDLAPSPESLATLELFLRFLALSSFGVTRIAATGKKSEKFLHRVSEPSLQVYVNCGGCELLSPSLRPTLGNEERLNQLIDKGQSALDGILPFECVAPPAKARQFDSALLFLIYPLDLIGDEMAQQVLELNAQHLEGPIGIRRYLGDSFWSPNYKSKLPPEQRTADWSGNLAGRDAMAEVGNEAQWCVFDSIVSIVHGAKFGESRDHAALSLQMKYLSRALGQLTNETGPFHSLRCPELYYLCDGVWQPNDATPLLWSQANLWMALLAMEKSLS